LIFRHPIKFFVRRDNFVDLNILFFDFRLIKTPFDPKWKQTFDQLLII
jgi:hypothetical protein